MSEEKLDSLPDALDLQIDGNHYKHGEIQPIEYMFSHGIGKDFCKGNIIKYISRLGYKGDKQKEIDDVLKSIHYALLLLKFEYGENYSITKI